MSTKGWDSFDFRYMLAIGCHLSTSKGYEAMGQNALEIAANTFQFFTRNPRGSKAKDIDPIDVGKLINILEENQFAKLLAHAPYTLNPFSSHKDRHEKIGEGSIGLDTFEKIINHPKLVHLPFYLETPNELDGYAKEVCLLSGFLFHFHKKKNLLVTF